MHRSWFAAAAVPLLISGCSNDMGDATGAVSSASAQSAPQDAEAVLAEVRDAMGMDGLEAITLNGTAWRIRNSFMQTPSANPPWPSRDEITNFSRTIDLTQPASSASGDTFASNLFLDPPTAGTYRQYIGGDEQRWSQQLEIWLTPWGFITGAEQNGAEVDSAEIDGETRTMLTWQSPESQTSPSGMRYTVNGYVNDDNLIDRVETWVEDAFMGDFHIVQVYDDYREIDGVMVPATIEQQRGGGGVFGVEVASAEANPANVAELVAAPQGGGQFRFGGGGPGGPGGQQAAPQPEQIDENVYVIPGAYAALAVGFEDHVLVFEAGASEARGEEVLASVKTLFPDKDVRYIVNSHPHSDHTAGLIPFIREGATLVTHENNVEFLEMALSTPRTLLGEEPLDPKVQGVEGVGVFEDDNVRLELHPVPTDHSDGMLVGYLPEQKILFQADFSLPQGGAQANPFVVALAEYVDETGLDFERYIPIHPAPGPQTKADLMAALEQNQEPQ